MQQNTEPSEEPIQTPELNHNQSRCFCEVIDEVTPSKMEPKTTHQPGAVRNDPENSNDTDTDQEISSSVQEDRSFSDLDNKDSSMSLVSTSDVAHSSSDESEAGEYTLVVRSTRYPETSLVIEFAAVENGEEMLPYSGGETDESSDKIKDAHPDDDIVSLLKSDCLNRGVSDSTEVHNEPCIRLKECIPDKILVAARHVLRIDYPAGMSWPVWEAVQESDDILKRTWVKEGSKGVIQAKRAPTICIRWGDGFHCCE